MAGEEPAIRPIRALRASRGRSADPRPGRTRQAILDAVRVLAEQGRDEITVGDIVAQGGISRSAFYTQFAGIDELALSVLTDALDQVSASVGRRAADRRVPDDEVIRAVLTAFVAHVQDNRSLYTSVLALPFTHLTHMRVVEAVAARVAASIEFAGVIQDPTRIRATSAWVAGGLLTVLNLWMGDQLPGSADALIDELITLLPAAALAGPASA